jgi:hypothetical protein
MEKISDRAYSINIPDYITESLVYNFLGKKYVKFLVADPESGAFLTLIQDGQIRIRDNPPRSATLTERIVIHK